MSYLPVRRSTFRLRSQRGFGDVLSSTVASTASGTPEAATDYQSASLAELRNISAWQQRWVEKDEMQRWLQIIATVTIPLSAAIWRLIFRRGM